MKKKLFLSIAYTSAFLATTNTVTMFVSTLKRTVLSPKKIRSLSQKEQLTQQLKQNAGTIDYHLELYTRCFNRHDDATEQYNALKKSSIFEKIPLFGQFFQNSRDDKRLEEMLATTHYSEQLNIGKKILSQLYDKRFELLKQLKSIE